MSEGFLLIDKERGWTSHDVVAKLRRLTEQRRAGHAGTLDPMATGLLVVGLGRVTRLLRFVQELAKEYVARMAFGVATDTLDADGAILSREAMPVTAAEVRDVLPRFTGRIMQVPPMVSALRVEGRRLYELARRGVEVERAARPVEVYELELGEFAPGEYPEAVLRVRCSTGTYVRTLADDIAQALGGRAHLAALRRTTIGSLHVEEGRRIGEVEAAAGRSTVEEVVVAPADGLRDLPAVTVAAEAVTAVCHGTRFARGFARDVDEGSSFRVLDQSGRLLAVYRAEGKLAVAEVVLG